MDTVTHAMLGAVVARSLGFSRVVGDRLSASGRAAVSGIAAAFPDIDYLSFWLDPYRFLTEWHRGVTHSLLMLPLWSLLLGITIAVISRQSAQWRSFTGWSAVGLASHILADTVTVFGTQVFAPLNDWRVALGWIFDVDPWISLILAIALLASISRNPAPLFARVSLFVMFAYLGASAIFKQNAAAIGRADLAGQSLNNAVVHALPQPLSPGHWKLIVERSEGYEVAYVDLFSIEWTGFAKSLRQYFPAISDYRLPKKLIWKSVDRLTVGKSGSALAAAVWRYPRMERFRRFSAFPALYRIDRGDDATCVWFTDLRYVLPGIGAPFRYGMCRVRGEAEWRLHRLLRFTENRRDRLE